MKVEDFYLGISHSPLVTSVFKAAMAHLKVPEENQKLLGRRHIFPMESPQSLDRISNELEAAFKKLDRKGYKRAMDQLEHTIRQLAPSGFWAVVPHCNQIIYQEIIRHSLCRGYFFAEEGITSMCWSAKNETPKNIRARLKQTFRAVICGSRFQVSRPMFDCSNNRYLGAFSISNEAFIGMPGVTNVSSSLPGLSTRDVGRRIFIVLDALYLHSGIKWDAYRNALVATLRVKKSENPELFLKFHFAENNRQERFREISRELPDMNITLLEPSFCIEDELTQNDLVLYASSSLGFYTRLLGSRSESFIERIEGVDLDDLQARGVLPKVFCDMMTGRD